MKQRLNLLREFSVPLLAGVIIALVWANLDPSGYHAFNSTPFIGGLSFHFVSNELFMVFFFGIAAVEITQSWVGPDGQKRRGGCTVLFDLETHEARYLIRKRVGNLARIEAEKRNRQAAAPGATLWDSYFGGGETNEPFAALHRH